MEEQNRRVCGDRSRTRMTITRRVCSVSTPGRDPVPITVSPELRSNQPTIGLPGFADCGYLKGTLHHACGLCPGSSLSMQCHGRAGRLRWASFPSTVPALWCTACCLWTHGCSHFLVASSVCGRASAGPGLDSPGWRASSGLQVARGGACSQQALRVRAWGAARTQADLGSCCQRGVARLVPRTSRPCCAATWGSLGVTKGLLAQTKRRGPHPRILPHAQQYPSSAHQRKPHVWGQPCLLMGSSCRLGPFPKKLCTQLLPQPLCPGRGEARGATLRKRTA